MCNDPADESRAQDIERAKQEQLRQQKEGKGEWKDTLASESESVVSRMIVMGREGWDYADEGCVLGEGRSGRGEGG